MARKLTGREADYILAALNVYAHWLAGDLQEIPGRIDPVEPLLTEVATNSGLHPKPTGDFLSDISDAIQSGEIPVKRDKVWKVKLFGEADNGERFGIWEGRLIASTKQEAIDKAIEDHFDERLRGASVRAAWIVEREDA